MSELRWILLLVGLLFLVVLAAWETHRSRRATAPREAFPHFDHEPRLEPAARPDAAPPPPPPAERSLASASGTGPQEPQLGELPEGLVDSPHLDGTDGAHGTDGADSQPIRAQHGGTLDELPQVSAEPLGASVAQPPPIDSPAKLEPAAELEPPANAGLPPMGPAAVGSGTPAPQAAGAPRVDWPAEGERHIISVRIVGLAEPRLSGRSARQALAACGFVHGRYRIFHQPAEDGRALLSCASLSKPGNFDTTSMDFQRFAGLSLFTVLPGPLPAPEALDRLLDTARDLSHRLQAQLLDDQGQPLDATRIMALRSSVQQLAFASAADVADSTGSAVARGGPGA